MAAAQPGPTRASEKHPFRVTIPVAAEGKGGRSDPTSDTRGWRVGRGRTREGAHLDFWFTTSIPSSQEKSDL